MLPQIYSAEIFQEENNKELLIKLIHQLNKDFNITGIDKGFEEDISINELISQLNTLVENLMKNDFQTYVNLLYRVDVSESKMRQIDDIEMEKIAQKVTSLILIREWQKAVSYTHLTLPTICSV